MPTYSVIETLPDRRERVLATGLTLAEATAWKPARQTWAISFRQETETSAASVAARAARDARTDLRAEITFDSGDDPWDWARGRAAHVLDLMDLAGIPIPAEIDYTPAPDLDWDTFNDDAVADLLRLEWESLIERYGPHAADDALTYWARVLTRYLSLPAVAALSD